MTRQATALQDSGARVHPRAAALNLRLSADRTRRARAMDAGAGVDADNDFADAIRRESRRPRMWAIDELAGMGALPGELVVTARKFGEMHLELEPRGASSFLSDGIRASGKMTPLGEGVGVTSTDRAMLYRADTAANVAWYFDHVREALDDETPAFTAREMKVFAACFAPQRPTLRELRALGEMDYPTARKVIENGLKKLWAAGLA